MVAPRAVSRSRFMNELVSEGQKRINISLFKLSIGMALPTRGISGLALCKYFQKSQSHLNEENYKAWGKCIAL